MLIKIFISIFFQYHLRKKHSSSTIDMVKEKFLVRLEQLPILVPDLNLSQDCLPDIDLVEENMDSSVDGDIREDSIDHSGDEDIEGDSIGRSHVEEIRGHNLDHSADVEVESASKSAQENIEGDHFEDSDEEESSADSILGIRYGTYLCFFIFLFFLIVPVLGTYHTYQY